MKLPHWLEEKRDEIADITSCCRRCHDRSFNACAELLLPEIEALREVLSKSNEELMHVFELGDPILNDIEDVLARINERFPK